MTTPACKKEKCEECENMACRHPCHFLPPDEEIVEDESVVDEEEEDMHLEDGEGEEDIF